MGSQCCLPPEWPDSGDSHAFTPACCRYAFIDPGRMKGWVDLGGWLLQDGLPYPETVTHPSINRTPTSSQKTTSTDDTTASQRRQTGYCSRWKGGALLGTRSAAMLTSKARHRRSLSRRRHLYRSGTLSHRELTTGHCKACRQEVRLVMSDDGSDGFMQWTKCHRHTADDKPDLEERMMAMGEVQAYNSGSWTVRELQRFAFVWVVSFVFVLWQLLYCTLHYNAQIQTWQTRNN